ncbi:MAG: hypothetical protein CM1200mP10_19090 [Candidatus Neomarinimicrobiota bacterium]|nr:MAG: hypothetical protein CM1200mP10_19090 [Candidatus Neomarinimicrobiota bacterium]
MGINLTGEVGHEILITDLVAAVESDITHLFLYDENSITTGKIALADLANNEEIEIHVKAWDNANNPAELTIKLTLLMIKAYDSLMCLIFRIHLHQKPNSVSKLVQPQKFQSTFTPLVAGRSPDPSTICKAG